MADTLTLFIEPVNAEFAELYKSAADTYNKKPMEERDSGFDLYSDGDDVNSAFSKTALLVGQGCRAAAFSADGAPRAFWLAPRSSISKTKWRLANSLGLIDATYRGVIRAALGSTDLLTFSTEYNRMRLCQLATPSLVPWGSVVVVESLPMVGGARGAGGFGSTGST